MANSHAAKTRPINTIQAAKICPFRINVRRIGQVFHVNGGAGRAEAANTIGYAPIASIRLAITAKNGLAEPQGKVNTRGDPDAVEGNDDPDHQERLAEGDDPAKREDQKMCRGERDRPRQSPCDPRFSPYDRSRPATGVARGSVRCRSPFPCAMAVRNLPTFPQ